MRVNIYTEISNFSYGVYGKNIALELNKRLEVCLAPLYNKLLGIERDELPEIQKMTSRLDTINFNDTAIMFGNGNQMFRFTGGKKIGFTYFISDELDDSWINQLKQLTAVCVPSNWHSGILAKYNINATTIGPGVNLSIFKPRAATANSNQQSGNVKFKFLSIGKWDSRKNQRLTLEAFCEEFRPDENVELYCMWHNPFSAAGFLPDIMPLITNKHKIYTKENPDYSTIYFLNPVTSLYQLANIYSEMQCAVFPYKSEASCLRLLECMVSGLPCIASNYSAPTDFINDKNCYLLKTLKKTELQSDKNFTGFKGHWLEPDKRELRKLMREVYSNYSAASMKGQYAAVELKRYSWSNTAQKILNLLLN